MGKRYLGVAMTIAVALTLVSASAASAATEVGNRCIGNTSTTGASLISTANAPGSPLPNTVPSAGVITRWSFTVVPIPPGVLFQTLKVFRPTGVPKQFQVVNESLPASIVSGLNTFPTRQPVQAGDYLGYSGTAEGTPVTVYCKTETPGDRVGAVVGNPPAGSTVTVTEEGEKLSNPLVAVVEPDADNDGFGDETQDLCPQSGAVQTACPPVKVDASKVVRKGSVTVLITVDSQAPVKVTGTVNLGKGKKAKLSGGTKTVTPGKITRFKLKFSKALKERLGELSSKQSLNLKITATATNVAGQVSTDKLKAKLKGQG